MAWDLPSELLSFQYTSLPQVVEKSSYTNLAAAASVDLDFQTKFAPFFDVFVYMDQTGIIRFYARSRVGDTFRQVGADWLVAVNTALPITRYRAVGNEGRWRLIADAATGTLEFHVVNRSI